MFTQQIKNKIKECLIERHWRNLAEIFKPPQNETLLNVCTQEPELRSGGLGLELILERINEGIQTWDLLVHKDDNPVGARLEDILKTFKDFNYSIRNLPGENNFINKDDNQQKDWSRDEEDETRFKRIETLKTYWDEKGHNLKLWVYQNVEYPHLDEEINIIKSDFNHYHKTSEFTAILEKYFDTINARELLKNLNKKLSLKEAEYLLTKIKNLSSEFDVWKTRIKNAKIILADIHECRLGNSWECDCKVATHFGKTKELEFFSDYEDIPEVFELIKNRLENVLKIKHLINSLPLDFDSLTNLTEKFPLKYQFPDSKKADRLLQDHSRILHLRAIINLDLPDEWQILKLVMEINTSGIKLADAIYERFELAQVRTSVLDILRIEISPRKSLTDREEIYFKNIEPAEDKLKDWKLPEFINHWQMFQTAKHKKALLEDLNQILETLDLKKALKLFDDAEKNLSTNVFWVKNRNKFVALKAEAEPFEKLLVDIQSSSSSNQFHSNLEAFRDLINFPLKYKGYKQELENLIQDKLKAWTIKIDRFEKHPNSNICWFIGWNWLHINLINRVYISLQKDRYPLNPSNAPLVKETQPYEYNMHQSGTMVIPNTTNFQDYILTVWPGAEFYSYQDKKDWIKILGNPHYFKWDAKKSQWKQCKRP
jgi:hypothetical protein